MKRLINMAVSVTICVFCTFFAAHADGIPPEKYEHITTSKITPWITNYHLATPEHLEDNIKGGEGYQIPYAAAISDADANIMIRGYDTSGVYWSEASGFKRMSVQYFVAGVLSGQQERMLCTGLRNRAYGRNL